MKATPLPTSTRRKIQRKISISTASLAYAEWKKAKINILDTPGYNIFINDTRVGLVAADAALVVVDGVAGVEVQTEKVWAFANDLSCRARSSLTSWIASAPASSARSIASRRSSAAPPSRSSFPGAPSASSRALSTWYA